GTNLEVVSNPNLHCPLLPHLEFPRAIVSSAAQPGWVPCHALRFGRLRKVTEGYGKIFSRCSRLKSHESRTPNRRSRPSAFRHPCRPRRRCACHSPVTGGTARDERTLNSQPATTNHPSSPRPQKSPRQNRPPSQSHPRQTQF